MNKRKYFFPLVLVLLVSGCASSGMSCIGGGSGSGATIGLRVPFGSSGESDFCGSSTYGECGQDSNCAKDGCSGQVCQSKTEKSIMTTCEYRECYDSDRYNLNCKCINNKCQWK